MQSGTRLFLVNNFVRSTHLDSSPGGTLVQNEFKFLCLFVLSVSCHIYDLFKFAVHNFHVAAFSI